MFKKFTNNKKSLNAFKTGLQNTNIHKCCTSDILNADFSINKKNIKENFWKLIA